MICFSQWMMPHFLIRKNIDMSALKTSFENLPKGFVTPPITIPMNELTDSNSKKIYGIWRNVNIYHKIPSSDGYSPYSLQNTMDKVELVFDENIKKKPLVFLNNSTGESKFETIKFSQNQLTLRTHTMEENILCYNQNYYPGWTARIDGVETKIIGNNEEIIATRLAQGIHEVSFSFEPKGIKQIFVFSASALILCIGLIVFFTFYQGKSILSKLAVGLLFVMFVPLIVKGLSQRKTSDKEVINWISQTIRKIKSTDDFNLELYIATSRELNSSIIDKYTQVNFHRKNDLAKFQKFLAESKGNKIAFVCVNHQIPEQAKKMLTYYFGEKTDTYQYEDATIELYDRRNSFTHSRGCIQLNEDCSADNALCDKTIVIDSTRKYFTLYQQSIENICDEFPCDITAVLRVKDDLGANANFVISIIDEDGKGQSKGEKILNETTKANNWGEVFLTYRVESHQKRGEAKFFISKEKKIKMSFVKT